MPDPLRRIRVPDDLDAVTTIGPEADTAGLRPRGREAIWKAASDLYRTGMHPAVQVCVRHQGKVVLDRAIGHARGNGPHDAQSSVKLPATPETPFVTYSCSKAVTAVVIHLLHERGVLDLESPVSAYIPGYGRHGKAQITIAHVLAHRAGVPNLPREVFELDRLGDRDFLVSALSDARPFARPGRFLAYHAVSGGYILGEVVHQVTGQDIRTVLAEEVLDPLGMRWTNYGAAERDLDQVALNYLTGPPTAPPASQLVSRALGLPLDALIESSNDPRFQTAIVPSANLISTAREFSRFYELLCRGGELDGVRVLAAKTIRAALREQSHLEVDLSLGWPTRFSYGFMLGSRVLSLYGRDTQHAFGHLGFTNMLTWADPQRALSCAVMTNGKPLLYPELSRFYLLMAKVTAAVSKIPGSRMRVWDPGSGRPS
ncbi:MAG: serine hydrolase domain-containing protein [Solirubrobacteraceae bacterium]